MAGRTTRDQATPAPPAAKAAGGLGSIGGTLRQLKKEKALVRGTKALRLVNQTEGFDCPGCAWPDPAERSFAEFCENGAKAVAAESTTKLADPAFFAAHSITELRAHDDHWLEQQGRLSHPLIRRGESEHFEPLPWPEAFATAAAALRALPDPNLAAFYTSGRTSNEAAFLLQLFVRMFGTNNLPDCSNLCHESSGVGLKQTIGLGKGSVSLEDFEHADAIFVLGQNPGTNHPRMLTALQAARRRGAHVVSINPLRERGLESFTHPQEVVPTLLGRGTAISTVYLQPKVGSDVAVLKGMMKHVLAAEQRNPGRVLDHGFIRAHTIGLDALAEDLAATTWAQIEEQSGLSEAQIAEASDVYIRSGATIICWAMGLTQHVNGVDNVIACSNLLLLKGNIGRPGAGACPVRGHSNVQGDRTVGITCEPRPALLDKLEANFNFQPPREPGLDVVNTIRAMDAGRIRFFLAMGGNFHSASPDTALVAEAMCNVPMSVFIATKLNRSHLADGDTVMIWPCLGRTERDVQASGPQRVTVEDSMSCVHASEGRNTPASPHLLSEPAIVAGIAAATLPDDHRVDWAGAAGDYSRIRDMIEDTIPIFADYNRRIEEPGGFVLPHPASQRRWTTASGSAEFVVVPTPALHLPADQLRLFTIRSHDQFNTTIYGKDDRYRGISGDRHVVFMHPDDLADRGLRDGQAVVIRAEVADGRERMAAGFRARAYDVPRGCAAAYFPEANVLVPIGRTAKGSNTPAFKLVPVTVTAEAAATAGAQRQQQDAGAVAV